MARGRRGDVIDVPARIEEARHHLLARIAVELTADRFGVKLKPHQVDEILRHADLLSCVAQLGVDADGVVHEIPPAPPTETP